MNSRPTSRTEGGRSQSCFPLSPCRAVVGNLSHSFPHGGCDTAKWFERGVDPVFRACEETNHRRRTLLKIRTSMTQQDKVRDVKNLRGSN